MARFETSVTINRPVEEVWKFITDPSNMSKWSNILESKQTSPGLMGVGTTIQDTYANQTQSRLFGIARVAEYEPNQKYTVEYPSGPAKGSKYSLSTETIEGKTRLNGVWDIKLRGFYKLAGPFMARGAKRGIDAQVARLKSVLESEAKS